MMKRNKSTQYQTCPKCKEVKLEVNFTDDSGNCSLCVKRDDYRTNDKLTQIRRKHEDIRAEKEHDFSLGSLGI